MIAEDVSAASAGPSVSADIELSAAEILFADRYRIQPDVVLPHLSTTSARAYLATDTSDPKKDMYALVLDRAVPARGQALVTAKSVPHDALTKPVRWGRVDWNEPGRQENVIVLEQPSGTPLMPSLNATVQPWTVRELKRDLLAPILDLIRRVHGERLTHRNIRPTNLFRRASDGQVMSGQFYSAPAGYDQPAMFESLERALCPPIARGNGDMSDEMSAIGVTLLILALGRNPVAGIDDKTLLTRRVEVGSYNAILGDTKLPAELAPIVRALMRGEDHERWSLTDLSNWVHSGRVNPSQPMPGVRADRPFEFNGQAAHTARELAYILSTDWTAAAKVAGTETIARWVDRSLKNRDLAKEVADCSLLGVGGPRQMTDDIRLSRVIATLDPTGPIRFRRMTVMPDAFGPAAVMAVQDKSLAADFTDLILGKLMGFWHELQLRPKTWMVTASEVAEKASIFLAETGSGFSIERCAYELNPTLPCLSPLVGRMTPTQPREMLEVIEEKAGQGELAFDRHIAAFLGARINGSIDRELGYYARASGELLRRVAQLRLLAFVQSKNSSTAAKNLFALFLDSLQPIFDEYRNTRLREQLLKDARRAKGRGSLNDLVRIIDNAKTRRLDERGFEIAQRRQLAIEAEVAKLQKDETFRQRQANRLGRQIAANVASVISILVLGALVVTRMG